MNNGRNLRHGCSRDNHELKSMEGLNLTVQQRQIIFVNSCQLTASNCFMSDTVVNKYRARNMNLKLLLKIYVSLKH